MKGARYYAGIVLSILLGIIAGSAAAGWAIRVFKYTSGMCSLALLGGCASAEHTAVVIVTLLGFVCTSGGAMVAAVCAFAGNTRGALWALLACVVGMLLVTTMGLDQ